MLGAFLKGEKNDYEQKKKKKKKRVQVIRVMLSYCFVAI
jgi:hypothetical protein